MKSAQGVYPVIPDDDTAFAFVEFIHSRDRLFCLPRRNPGPQKSTFPSWTARETVLQRPERSGIFRPDALAAAHGKATQFFPGFTIRFLHDNQFSNAAGVKETLTPGDYNGQFHWHDGHGSLAIDASSYPLSADGFRHPHFSADFAYYSLPILLTPVI
jgi:hypothetical protein